MTDGRLDAGILRPLLVALAMIAMMLLRPRGLWPEPGDPPAAPDSIGPRKTGIVRDRPPAP